jgi:hypothetical protein
MQALTHDSVYNKIASTDPLGKLQGTLRGLSDMLNWVRAPYLLLIFLCVL